METNPNTNTEGNSVVTPLPVQSKEQDTLADESAAPDGPDVQPEVANANDAPNGEGDQSNRGEQPAADPPGFDDPKKDQPDTAAKNPARPINPVVVKAAEDVRILYAYAARNCKFDKEKSPEDMAVYAEISDKVIFGTYTYDEELKLWRILSELSILIRPATAESIRDSHYLATIGIPSPGKHLLFGKDLRGISTIGIIGFVLTLLLGLYVSFTEGVLIDTTKRIEEYAAVATGQYKGTRLEKIYVASDSPLSLPSAKTNSGMASEKSITASPPQPIGAAPQQGASTPPAKPETDDITVDETNTTDDKSNDIQGHQNLDDYRSTAQAEIENEIKSGFKILRATTFGLGASADESRNTENGSFSIFERVPINVQGYINKIIANFLLPVMASVLGVFVFILRDAGRRMESVSLSPLRSASYWPRIILGVIAGIVIGWFMSEDSSGVLTRISPAAGAFVLGYSTEVLFNLLDSIKQALGVKDQGADLPSSPV